jgi:hypothetical protein
VRSLPSLLAPWANRINARLHILHYKSFPLLAASLHRRASRAMPTQATQHLLYFAMSIASALLRLFPHTASTPPIAARTANLQVCVGA